jgi:hypothetical protein
MENIFVHNPTTQELDSIGVTEANEADYLARLKKEGEHFSNSLLLDLNALFSLRNDTNEVQRIDGMLEKNEYFTNLFNE